jgi:hypothetical protein
MPDLRAVQIGSKLARLFERDYHQRCPNFAGKI